MRVKDLKWYKDSECNGIISYYHKIELDGIDIKFKCQISNVSKGKKYGYMVIAGSFANGICFDLKENANVEEVLDFIKEYYRRFK